MQVPPEQAELFWFLKHYMNQPRKGNASGVAEICWMHWTEAIA